MPRTMTYKLFIFLFFVALFLGFFSVLAHWRQGTIQSFKENFVATCSGQDTSEQKERICECLADQIIIQVSFLQLSNLNNNGANQKYIKEYLSTCIFNNRVLR